MIDVLHAGRLKGHQNQPHTRTRTIHIQQRWYVRRYALAYLRIQRSRSCYGMRRAQNAETEESIFDILLRQCVELALHTASSYTVCTRLMVYFVLLISLYACLWLQSLKRNTIHSTCRPIQSKHTSGTKSSEKYI